MPFYGFYPLDGPVVTLSEKCRGEVKINNNTVCSSNWNMDYSHLVCQEQQDCSNAIFSETTKIENMHSQHVACEDYHDKLGQCSTFKGPCSEGHVSVYCVGMYKYTPVSL